MRRRPFDAAELSKKRGGPQRQLAPQVAPLVIQLPARDIDTRDASHLSHLAARKRVTARGRFFVDRGEIGVDGEPRRSMRSKTLELRVVLVTARPAAEVSEHQLLLEATGS